MRTTLAARAGIAFAAVVLFAAGWPIRRIDPLPVSHEARPEVMSKCDHTHPMPSVPPSFRNAAHAAVRVSFYVGYEGQVSAIRFISGSRDGYRAVVEAVSQWKFGIADEGAHKRFMEIQFVWNDGAVRIGSFTENDVVEDFGSLRPGPFANGLKLIGAGRRLASVSRSEAC